jgi:diguanylate cyclase (GGDEF)-like protein
MRSGAAFKARMVRIVTVAWLLVPAIVVAFVVLRSMPGTWALVGAQLVFLAPIAAAALAAEIAFSIGPTGMEQRAWGMVSLTALVLLFSEGYYSSYQVAVNPAGPPSPSIYDALNLIAAVMIAVGIAQIAGVGRLGLAERVRLALDTVAFSAVTFLGMYHFVTKRVAPHTPWVESARWTAYSLVGVLIIIGTVWLLSGARPGIERRLMTLVGLALGIFATGMLLWPIWRAGTGSGSGTSSGSFLDAIMGGIYLTGYCLLMMAGLARLRDYDDSWRSSNARLPNTEGVWVSTVLSLYVLVGAAFIGWWLYTAPGLQADVRLYATLGLLATFALVARTGVTAIETVLARSTADLDPVTGAPGLRTFTRRADEALATQGVGDPVSLIVFDMDAFSAVNSALGHSGGDRVLADVAKVVSSAAEGRGDLYRLSADEFVVLCPIGEGRAAVLSAEILSVIRGLTPVEGRPLSASMGVAGCSGGECSREELLGRANAAQAWAKYHGKGRVVRFDERIVRALGVEERLREHEDQPGLEMARALASAADARDPRNYYHSRNVASLAVLFSEALGLEADQVRRIEVAAMLHDCGKLGLPDELLADVLRSSRLQMAAREHSALGEALVQSVALPDVPSWIRHHHERWDGAGYPDALSGEAVPLESRIIALADAYDAMTSGVRNRMPMSRGAALQEIDLGMGSRFDPELAERFIEVVGATASLGWSDDWALA